MSPDERNAAEMAMTFLLDDPSPKVRLAMAEAIAWSPDAPRAIVLSLASVTRPKLPATPSPARLVLSDADLIDLAARGSAVTRMLIAARSTISRPVAAAFAEIGEEEDVLCLLENEGAAIAPQSLKRIAERLGDCCDVRNLLLDRVGSAGRRPPAADPHVSNALINLPLAQAAIGAAACSVLPVRQRNRRSFRLPARSRRARLPIWSSICVSPDS
jgi:uncharacterized protein (DUF2336 family)